MLVHDKLQLILMLIQQILQAVKKLCLLKNIQMVVVGPEAPLVEGVHDFFLADMIS